MIWSCLNGGGREVIFQDSPHITRSLKRKITRDNTRTHPPINRVLMTLVIFTLAVSLVKTIFGFTVVLQLVKILVLKISKETFTLIQLLNHLENLPHRLFTKIVGVIVVNKVIHWETFPRFFILCFFRVYVYLCMVTATDFLHTKIPNMFIVDALKFPKFPDCLDDYYHAQEVVNIDTYY